jgi:hypothetical protein
MPLVLAFPAKLEALMHNVRLEQIATTAEKTKHNASAAVIKVNVEGDWRVDES